MDSSDDSSCKCILLSINTEFDLDLRQFFVSISMFVTVLD